MRYSCKHEISHTRRNTAEYAGGSGVFCVCALGWTANYIMQANANSKGEIAKLGRMCVRLYWVNARRSMSAHTAQTTVSVLYSV